MALPIRLLAINAFTDRQEGTIVQTTVVNVPDYWKQLLYTAYMLDLIPFYDMPIVLHEFKRALKRNGRIVTLNMSKAGESRVLWRERLYSVLPCTLVLYLMGGCRPVLMERAMREAAFGDVTRQFLAGRFPSEIVIARK